MFILTFTIVWSILFLLSIPRPFSKYIVFDYVRIHSFMQVLKLGFNLQFVNFLWAIFICGNIANKSIGVIHDKCTVLRLSTCTREAITYWFESLIQFVCWCHKICANTFGLTFYFIIYTSMHKNICNSFFILLLCVQQCAFFCL